MAVHVAFKVQCPTCQAAVPIKDESLIGKKVECPKCKDRFVVQSPKDGPALGDPDATLKIKGKISPKRLSEGNGQANLDSIGETIDEEEATPDEIAKAKKAKAKKKARDEKATKKEGDEARPKAKLPPNKV